MTIHFHSRSRTKRERESKTTLKGRGRRWRGAIHDCLTRVWVAQARSGKRPRRPWSAEWTD